MAYGIGHNNGPEICDGLTLDEAQALEVVQLRPSYVQRYAGPGAPLREIVGVAGYGSFGRWVLLECGHYREIRDYGMQALTGKKVPTKSRCGCCRLNYAPRAADVAKAEELKSMPVAA